MTTIPTITRRPHFRRYDPPPILITDDDIKMVRFVAEHRFRRSTDIAAYMAHRSTKKIIERLGVLFHTAYLDRPRAQRDYFTAGKRTHYVYALGNRGAELLAELDGVAAPKVDWTDKNRDVGRPYIRHALLVGDVASAFARAATIHPDMHVIEPADILARAPASTQRADNPWKWRAKVPAAGGLLQEIANVPDRVFGLDFTQARKRCYFFLEADRATMPIVRTNLQQTSLHRKFLSYWHGYRAKHHEQLYGIGNFRVLVVTSGPKRSASMVEAVKQITGGAGSNLFLFADAPALASSYDVLSLEWITGKGERTTLAC
jgi:Replication-relaxation